MSLIKINYLAKIKFNYKIRIFHEFWMSTEIYSSDKLSISYIFLWRVGKLEKDPIS